FMHLTSPLSLSCSSYFTFSSLPRHMHSLPTRRSSDLRRTPKGEVLKDDVAVSNYLLTEGHVSSVPGLAYGLSPFFRISTATSDEILKEAIARIGRAVAALEPAEAAL